MVLIIAATFVVLITYRFFGLLELNHRRKKSYIKSILKALYFEYRRYTKIPIVVLIAVKDRRRSTFTRAISTLGEKSLNTMRYFSIGVIIGLMSISFQLSVSYMNNEINLNLWSLMDWIEFTPTYIVLTLIVLFIFDISFKLMIITMSNWFGGMTEFGLGRFLGKFFAPIVMVIFSLILTFLPDNILIYQVDGIMHDLLYGLVLCGVIMSLFILLTLLLKTQKNPLSLYFHTDYERNKSGTSIDLTPDIWRSGILIILFTLIAMWVGTMSVYRIEPGAFRISEKYYIIESLYFSITSITSVGFGDRVPELSVLQISWTMISMLSSLALLGLLISSFFKRHIISEEEYTKFHEGYNEIIKIGYVENKEQFLTKDLSGSNFVESYIRFISKVAFKDPQLIRRYVFMSTIILDDLKDDEEISKSSVIMATILMCSYSYRYKIYGKNIFSTSRMKRVAKGMQTANLMSICFLDKKFIDTVKYCEWDWLFGDGKTFGSINVPFESFILSTSNVTVNIIISSKNKTEAKNRIKRLAGPIIPVKLADIVIKRCIDNDVNWRAIRSEKSKLMLSKVNKNMTDVDDSLMYRLNRFVALFWDFDSTITTASTTTKLMTAQLLSKHFALSVEENEILELMITMQVLDGRKDKMKHQWKRLKRVGLGKQDYFRFVYDDNKKDVMELNALTNRLLNKVINEEDIVSGKYSFRGALISKLYIMIRIVYYNVEKYMSRHASSKKIEYEIINDCRKLGFTNLLLKPFLTDATEMIIAIEDVFDLYHNKRRRFMYKTMNDIEEVYDYVHLIDDISKSGKVKSREGETRFARKSKEVEMTGLFSLIGDKESRFRNLKNIDKKGFKKILKIIYRGKKKIPKVSKPREESEDYVNLNKSWGIGATNIPTKTGNKNIKKVTKKKK